MKAKNEVKKASNQCSPEFKKQMLYWAVKYGISGSGAGLESKEKPAFWQRLLEF